MEDLILQFQHDGGKPGLDQARALFGLLPEEVDAGYGVVASDPTAGIYVILVKSTAAEKVRAAFAQRPQHPAEGLFGNPRIEPTGPPRD